MRSEGAVSTRPITIEEFDRLDLPQDRNWELHNGEIVEVSFPSFIHKLLQQRVSDLFRQAFTGAVVLEEMPFQIEATNDKRSADVGATSGERGRESRVKGVLSGAPELVVEILSPSNNALRLKQYRRLCLDHGTVISLTVDPDENTIEAHSKGDPTSRTWMAGEQLPIALFGEEKTIPVSAVFVGITLAPA
jgi:Uma2 family endonuclease